MNVRKIVLSLSLILIFVLSACSGAAATTPAMREKPPAVTEVMADTGSTDAMMGEKTSDAMMEGSATPDAMMSDTHDDSMMNEGTAEPMVTAQAGMEENSSGEMMSEATPEPMIESPAFFDATLTDASSMQPFTIKDFQGKVVLVETLAMWCSNCLQQQKQVKELHAQLGERDDFVSVGLDIDPNEEIRPLKSYVEKNGFDWTYAIAPPEVSREIGQRYGQQFLNPTSTPMFIIDRHGQVHTLPFGIKSAESLKEALDPFLNAGM
jgi:cytochrome oxidase Cu insertion factor (SCO1/SenC/PrrC family)